MIRNPARVLGTAGHGIEQHFVVGVRVGLSRREQVKRFPVIAAGDQSDTGGIAPFACSALHLLEGTNAQDTALALLLDRCNNRLDDRFQHALGLCLAQVMCSSHFPGQLDSIHTIRSLMVENQ